MKARSSVSVRIIVGGFAALLSLSPVVPGRAAEVPAKADTAKIYDPSDLENLRGERGKVITVEGTLARSGESKSKTVRYLNFSNDYRDSLALVFFVSKGGDLFAMEKLHHWIGKKVRATGRVSEYGSNVQIEIEKWDQLKEIK
jgi:hypothetical protein